MRGFLDRVTRGLLAELGRRSVFIYRHVTSCYTLGRQARERTAARLSTRSAFSSVRMGPICLIL